MAKARLPVTTLQHPDADLTIEAAEDFHESGELDVRSASLLARYEAFLRSNPF